MMSLEERAKQQIEHLRKLREEAVQLIKETGYQFLLKDHDEKKAEDEGLFPLRVQQLKELRVAAVMDRFTLDSYAPECNLLELTPTGWKAEIDQFAPDLVFIESAWKGKNDLWYQKIANGSKEFFEMADYCHAKKIPMVFWNKEDPIYTTTFLPAAHACDFVFTTDIDCIEQYKTALGHDRVYHLHFAAQPKLHNPVEKYERKNKFCFAGAYYHRYPKRAEVFDAFADVFDQREGLDIYDRNYKSALPEHAFPERYNRMILGKLDPSEIDIAYKGYVYGINMNSVNQSQTMFARRVFEMLASNTITVGNYARGLKNYFGDLTLCTDDPRVLEEGLKRYAGDERTARKYRLAGLRCALSAHLYEDRLAFIVRKVFGKDIRPRLPVVHVLATAANGEEAQRLIHMFSAQTYERLRMTLFADGVKSTDSRIEIKPVCDAKTKVGDLTEEGEYVAAMSAEDWYGENYILDMMLTLRYGSYRGMGKAAMYSTEHGKAVAKNLDQAYKPVKALTSTRAALSRELCAETEIGDFCRGMEVCADGLFAVDEFNYCRGCQEETCEEAKDLFIADQGIPLTDIEKAAESIQMTMIEEQEDTLYIGKQQIAQIPVPKDGTLSFKVTNEGAELTSTLEDGKHVYLYAKDRIPLEQYVHDGKLPILFQGVGDLDLNCVCIFYNAAGKKIGPMYPKLNRAESLAVPNGAAWMQWGIRTKGTGKKVVQGVTIGQSHEPDRLATFLSRSDTLVLSNHYPSYEALYRNMFVHKRMTAYKDDGAVFDAFRMNIYAQDGYREFEGINVIEGHADVLEKVLSNGRIKTVCVHFLDEQMWSVLKNHLGQIRLIVWLHGAEVQPWWRRTFNYHNETELEEAKKVSDRMMTFWRDVFSTAEKAPIHFVFVSEYFRNEVTTDHKVMLRPEQYSIIHNCIDTDMFTYVKKPVEQRKRILTIKPFASQKYGNDITAKAIVELSKDPIFKDLEIFIYGDGEYFEKDNAPLKRLGPNVHLHKTFLAQSEIAALHKTCGVYIATTRMDAQGVSRDEAMSSGLVPIASNVTAIPEFVDDQCGILVPGEEYAPIADAIKRLYNDPALFERLSENAAKRVRSQTSRPYTISKEIELIRGKTN